MGTKTRPRVLNSIKVGLQKSGCHRAALALNRENRPIPRCPFILEEAERKTNRVVYIY